MQQKRMRRIIPPLRMLSGPLRLQDSRLVQDEEPNPQCFLQERFDALLSPSSGNLTSRQVKTTYQQWTESEERRDDPPGRESGISNASSTCERSWAKREKSEGENV